MVVFAIDMDDPECYPPTGLRVAVCLTPEELKEELEEFFIQVWGCTEEDAKALEDTPPKVNALAAQVAKLAGGHHWSLYDPNNGYIYPETP